MTQGRGSVRVRIVSEIQWRVLTVRDWHARCTGTRVRRERGRVPRGRRRWGAGALARGGVAGGDLVGALAV